MNIFLLLQLYIYIFNLKFKIKNLKQFKKKRLNYHLKDMSLRENSKNK